MNWLVDFLPSRNLYHSLPVASPQGPECRVILYVFIWPAQTRWCPSRKCHRLWDPPLWSTCCVQALGSGSVAVWLCLDYLVQIYLSWVFFRFMLFRREIFAGTRNQRESDGDDSNFYVISASMTRSVHTDADG